MAEFQRIPARHGVATFVPAGHVIKIINSSGTQVVDTWAFALPAPEPKEDSPEGNAKKKESQQASSTNNKADTKTPSKKKAVELPSQEDAENTTRAAMKDDDEDPAEKKTSWGAYVPSLGWSSGKKDSKSGDKDTKAAEQKRNSKTWASYFPSGKGIGNYVPKSATDTASAFAATHQRNPDKSYLEQLQDFSKTPVGAAGWSGIAALTGSGYSGSMYAGYQAWSALSPQGKMMEHMSMPHTRVSTLHLRPRINDTLVSNLSDPMLTLIEDTSPGIHDTLIPACDPQRYKSFGLDKWEEHGSCAENLVLALKELNDRAGLKGARSVGADVTVNSAPAPLNLFMNIPWDDDGDIGLHAPNCQPKDYVRLKAERDIVVVMSACPNDTVEINNKNPTDAHFIVEGDEPTRDAVRRTQPRKRTPKKVPSSQKVDAITKLNRPPTKPSVGSDKMSLPQRRAAATKTTPTPARVTQSAPTRKKPVPPPVAPQTKKQATSTAVSAPASNNATLSTPKKKPRKLNASS